MTSPNIIDGLQTVADQYDAILCDVWGVIHNGKAAFGPACEALSAFRAQGKHVVLITNAPVPKPRVIRFFEPLGVPASAWDDCVSSGDAARDYLARATDKPLWIFGVDNDWTHDRFLYEGLDIERVDSADKAGLGLLMGPRSADDHPEVYREELRQIAALGLPMVCANPDIQVRIGDKLHWCGGALAAIFEDEGGTVIYPGKPHAPIYDAAFARLEGLTGPVDRQRVLAIGDGPATDIRGATAQGIDALYVGSGLASHAGGDFAEEVADLFAESKVSARYAMPELAW